MKYGYPKFLAATRAAVGMNPLVGPLKKSRVREPDLGAQGRGFFEWFWYVKSCGQFLGDFIGLWPPEEPAEAQEVLCHDPHGR
jgi:hypothetical protein